MTEQPSGTGNHDLLRIAAIAGVLGWCFDFFFSSRNPGASWIVFIVCILLGLAWTYRRRSTTWPHHILWLVIPLLLVAINVGFRASVELQTLSLLFSISLLLLVIVQSTQMTVFVFSVVDFVKTALLPLQWIPSFFRNVVSLFSMHIHPKNTRATGVLKGVIMAIPLLIIFGALFSSADLVFKKFIGDLFQFSINPVTVFHIGLTLFGAAIAFGALTYVWQYQQPPAIQKNAAAPRFIGSTEINVMLGLIAVLFLLFVCIQVTYLFGGQQTISDQGFTYADYARRGFFELLVVAVVSFVLLWEAGRAMTRHNHNTTIFRWISSIVIICVLGIMTSSFMRLALYEQAYGFTTQRLYSHVFTAYLGFLFVLLLKKILQHEHEPLFLRWAFGAAILTLLTLSVFNPDVYIARQNIERYQKTGNIDVSYLTTLSTDATPQLVRLLADKDTAIRQSVADALWIHQQELANPYRNSWLSWTWSQHEAERTRTQHQSEIERLRTQLLFQTPLQ